METFILHCVTLVESFVYLLQQVQSEISIFPCDPPRTREASTTCERYSIKAHNRE